jgi:hypothetical protein
VSVNQIQTEKPILKPSDDGHSGLMNSWVPIMILIPGLNFCSTDGALVIGGQYKIFFFILSLHLRLCI